MITITKGIVTATTEEGSRANMAVDKFIAALSPPMPELVLPDKVKFIKASPDKRFFIAAYEIDPGVHSVRWIDDDSEYKDGPYAKYKKRQLAMPYTLIVIPFQIGQERIVPRLELFECFYRNEPLTGMDQELYCPTLLNCSKFEPGRAESCALSWLCTQYLPVAKLYEHTTLSAQLWKLVKLSRWCLLESAFNWSSERNEMCSHYTDYCKWDKADERIKDVAKWEEESRKDPMFVLDLEWKSTGLTMGQLLERTFKLLGGGQYEQTITQVALERMVFNHQ